MANPFKGFHLAEPIRILHICPRHSFSGLESWVIEMIKYQKAIGLNPCLVVLAGSPMQELARKADIVTFEVAAPIGIWQLTKTVRRAVKTFEPEILHMHNSQDFKALGPWLAFNRRRFKTILQLHIWISHAKRDPLHFWLYKNLDELWCSSGPARKSLLKLLPVIDKQIRIVHYGRPVEAMEKGFLTRENARIELKLPLDSVIVGTVSRIDKGKGSQELFDGTVALMKTKADLHLVVIGGPTAERNAIEFAAELKAQSDSLPQELRSRVHWLGMLKDSYRYLKALDIFALPTYRECFSLALIEAQLAGLPCLTTSAGGSPELVREGETGWLCEPESTAAFQAALERALHEKPLWMSFGERAQARVRTEFDSKAVLGETIEGYQRLLS